MKINGTRKYFLSERELAHLSGLRVIRQSGMHSATSEESPNSSFVSALRQLENSLRKPSALECNLRGSLFDFAQIIWRDFNCGGA